MPISAMTRLDDSSPTIHLFAMSFSLAKMFGHARFELLMQEWVVLPQI